MLLCRATTTYLVQRRIDMLPKPLTEDICSLRSGVERLAFSVIWEVTPDVVPVAVRFTKSVIRRAAPHLPRYPCRALQARQSLERFPSVWCCSLSAGILYSIYMSLFSVGP